MLKLFLLLFGNTVYLPECFTRVQVFVVENIFLHADHTGYCSNPDPEKFIEVIGVYTQEFHPVNQGGSWICCLL